MMFGIVIFPPEDVSEIANNYRKRFDPHFPLIPPHMTVREAEEGDEGKLSRAAEHLELAAKQLRPFRVRLNRFSTFLPASNVVYMAPESEEELDRLHEAVCTGPLAVVERKYAYTPHLTVAQKLSDIEMHDIYASLRPIPLDLEFEVSQLHLLVRQDEGKWSVYRSFPFGNG